MLSRLLAALPGAPSLPDGAGILVALSGGADSVALLRLLLAAGRVRDLAVGACHVHHHLRGLDADRDLAFCDALCRRHGVPLAVGHLDPTPPAGRSPEAWWRQERYRLLDEHRRAGGWSLVATAHTRDDQAETVLIKLLRGAGPRGLAGIRGHSRAVIRPLLGFSREELRAYLTSLDQDWREDVTNRDETTPRGWVRWVLLPLLASRNPAIVPSLGYLATTLAGDEEYLAERLAEDGAWPRIGDPVPLAGVASLPPALRRRWLLALADRLPLAEPPGRAQLDAFETLLHQGRPAALDLGRRWILGRRGSRLWLEPPPCTPFSPLPAAVPGEAVLPGGFAVRMGLPERGAAHVAWLHRRLLNAAACWRSLRPGERFPVPGGTPVRPLLSRAGVPGPWRQAWPVLEADGRMIWVPGVGVEEDWLGDQVTGVLAEMEEPWARHEK